VCARTHDLCIQYEMRKCRIVICGLPDCTAFSTLRDIRHGIKNSCRPYSVCLDFLFSFCLKHFRLKELSEISTLCIGRYVKYPLLFLDFNES
jgi:hypothetical protein